MISANEIVAYSFNGRTTCLGCVERFDLTNPDEVQRGEEIYPVPAHIMKGNIKLLELVFPDDDWAVKGIRCQVPVCDTQWGADFLASVE